MRFRTVFGQVFGQVPDNGQVRTRVFRPCPFVRTGSVVLSLQVSACNSYAREAVLLVARLDVPITCAREREGPPKAGSQRSITNPELEGGRRFVGDETSI